MRGLLRLSADVPAQLNSDTAVKFPVLVSSSSVEIGRIIAPTKLHRAVNYVVVLADQAHAKHE